jgi:hypothetical protein
MSGLSLKHARRLEKNIGDKLVKMRAGIKPTIQLSIFDDVDTQINEANVKVAKFVSNYEELLAIRFRIRKNIEICNFNAGLNFLLNEEALLKEELYGLMILNDLCDNEEDALNDHRISVLQNHFESVKLQHSIGAAIQEHISVDKYLRTHIVVDMKIRVHNIKERLNEIYGQISDINSAKCNTVPMMVGDYEILTRMNIL